MNIKKMIDIEINKKVLNKVWKSCANIVYDKNQYVKELSNSVFNPVNDSVNKPTLQIICYYEY